MSLWRQLARGLRALSNRAATDHEVADEVDDYVEHARAAYIARGFSPHDATRAARLDIGNVTAAREQVRSYGWENAIETLFGDLRFAARRLQNESGIFHRRRHHIGARDRCDDGNFQRGKPHLVRAAALPARRTHRDDFRRCGRWNAARRHLRHVSGARDTQSFVRCDSRAQTWQPALDRQR